MSTTSIVGRYLFYSNSAFDANGSALGAVDDQAIAPDKQALLPGNTATFANYSSFDKGLNGIMVDIAGAVGSVTAADFQFKTGNDNDPADWSTLSTTPAVVVRPGEGTGASTRVEVVFPDGLITGKWLQINVKADAATRLPADDVFYFGNAVGESGDSASHAHVNAVDEIRARYYAGPAGLDNPMDFNRDGKVDPSDEAIAGAHYTTFLNGLNLIRTPALSGNLVVTHIETFNQPGGSINASHPPEGWTFTGTSSFPEEPVGARLTSEAGPVNDAGKQVGTSMVLTQNDFDLSAPLGANRQGYFVGGWFFFDEQTLHDDGFHGQHDTVFLWLQDQWGEGYSGHPHYLDFNALTGQVTPVVEDVVPGTVLPTTPLDVGFNKWVFFGMAIEPNNSAFAMRIYYKFQDGPLTTLMDAPAWAQDPVYPVTAHISSTPRGDGNRWSGRASFLVQAKITTLDDVSWQPTWADPPSAPNTWYVRRTADGSGNGLTYATAWSPAQMARELANGGIIPVTHASLFAATGLPVPDTIDVVALDQGYRDGTIIRGGDRVLIDEEGQQIRMPGGLSIGFRAQGVEIAPYHSQQVQIDCAIDESGPAAGGPQRWTDEGNGVWSIPLPTPKPYMNTGMYFECLWEDSKWMAFANNSNAAGIMAYCATHLGSFGFTDSKLYMSSFDGSDPNTNGKLYEAPGLGWVLTAPDEYVHGFSISKTGGVANVSLNGALPIYCVYYSCAGLTILRDLDTSYGGKHVFGTAGSADYSRGSRVVIMDCTASQGVPSGAYGVGYGSQTAGVFYVDTGFAPPDNSNQIFFDGWNSTINAGLIGSTAGVAADDQPGFLSHTNGANQYLPFSKVIFRNFASSSTIIYNTLSSTPWMATPDCVDNWGSSFDPPPDGLVIIPDPIVINGKTAQVAAGPTIASTPESAPTTGAAAPPVTLAPTLETPHGARLVHAARRTSATRELHQQLLQFRVPEKGLGKSPSHPFATLKRRLSAILDDIISSR